MENDDAEQNEPLSKFTTLPERISVRLHKQLMPGEVIEFTLRSVVGSHTEGGFGGVKPGFSFGSARSGNVQNDQMGHPWLIITNQRLILVSKGLISFETRTFRFDQINSVELQQGILSDKLLIQGIGAGDSRGLSAPDFLLLISELRPAAISIAKLAMSAACIPVRNLAEIPP